MGIVSSIGNSTGRCWPPCARASPASSGRRNTPSSASLPGGGDRLAGAGAAQAQALHGGVGWNYIAMEQAIRDAGLETKDVVDERTGIIMGEAGRRRAPSSGPPIRRASGTEGRPVRGAEGDVLGPSAARHHLPDQGHELLDLVGLRHERASATTRRADPVGPAGLMFAGGCEELDWTLGAVRRHGRHVLQVQRHPERPPRLRQVPRRLRHRRRRRAGARGASGPRRAAPASTGRWRATARVRTGSTWLPPPARARRGACGSR